MLRSSPRKSTYDGDNPGLKRHDRFELLRIRGRSRAGRACAVPDILLGVVILSNIRLLRFLRLGTQHALFCSAHVDNHSRVCCAQQGSFKDGGGCAVRRREENFTTFKKKRQASRTKVNQCDSGSLQIRTQPNPEHAGIEGLVCHVGSSKGESRPLTESYWMGGACQPSPSPYEGLMSRKSPSQLSGTAHILQSTRQMLIKRESASTGDLINTIILRQKKFRALHSLCIVLHSFSTQIEP